MRPSTWKALLWKGLGLLFYLAGMLLFVFVAVGVFLSPPEGSLANFSTADLPYVFASVALIVIGRAISWRFGGDPFEVFGGPEQSRLEELGYRMPAEPSEGVDRDVTYREGQLYVRCPECGTENDPEFTYCRDCSTELPDEEAAFE